MMRCSAVAPQPRCCARLPPRPSSRLCPRPARRRLALVAPPASSSCSQVLRCRGSGTPARCLPPRCWSSKVLRVYASEKRRSEGMGARAQLGTAVQKPRRLRIVLSCEQVRHECWAQTRRPPAARHAGRALTWRRPVRSGSSARLRGPLSALSRRAPDGVLRCHGLPASSEILSRK